MKNILYTIVLLSIALFAYSCNDFLDEMPDNRAELDTPEKITRILVSAYGDHTHTRVTELMSDNIDDYSKDNPNSDRFVEQVAYWEDITELDNDGPEYTWDLYYSAIANANQALEAIEELGGGDELNPQRGEALVCRAYHHFLLVNYFCMHYNDLTSASDLGIPYVEETEKTLSPKYSRGTVVETYEKIERDLLEGIELIDDALYTIPKFHFTRNAAYAFAARFFQYKGDWERSLEYANMVLGTSPSQYLRDNRAIAALPTDYDVYARLYASENEKANILLRTAVTVQCWPPYAGGYTYTRFSHGNRMNDNETFNVSNPWKSTDIINRVWNYSGNNHDIVRIAKVPYYFEYSDPIAGIGWPRTVTTDFYGDELLLTRAEAYVMLRQYENAISDINTWIANMYSTFTPVTESTIDAFFDRQGYYDPSEGVEGVTLKKRLDPYFDLSTGTQENLIHCILFCRRIQTQFEGLRWFDVKRWGIEIHRLTLDGDEIDSYATLKAHDLRQAIQLPQNVIAAGLTPNPR